jgi:hypothetical protein
MLNTLDKVIFIAVVVAIWLNLDSLVSVFFVYQ